MLDGKAQHLDRSARGGLRGAAARFAALLAPKKELFPLLYGGLGLGSASLIVMAWCVLSYGGIIGPDFLPTPSAVWLALLKSIANGSLFRNVRASGSVVLIGFVLAALVAVPLGIVMGSIRVVAAIVEPVTNFVRYLPVTALIPLMILWIGIGVEQKIAIIFFGVVFNLTIMVADVSARVETSLLEAGYTLGTTHSQGILRILFPACMPGVMDALRVNMGVAWTYVVVAELVSSSQGLGFMILNAMRGLFTEVIFLGIVAIGIMGLISDQVLKLAKRLLFSWAE